MYRKKKTRMSFIVNQAAKSVYCSPKTLSPSSEIAEILYTYIFFFSVQVSYNKPRNSISSLVRQSNDAYPPKSRQPSPRLSTVSFLRFDLTTFEFYFSFLFH